MTVHVLPIEPSNGYYSIRPVLDGVTYEIVVRLNDRMSAYFLDLYDAERTPLVLGRRVVIEWDIFGLARHLEGAPPGAIMAMDTTPRKEDPTFEDFGTRVLLVYHDADEIAGIQATALAAS
jgi:hypothetical protein